MNWIGNLQQLSRSLMIPMITLPAAAILLRFGQFVKFDLGYDVLGSALYTAGHGIFVWLPIIFAVGVAVGLSGNAISAALSAIIGYLLFQTIIEHQLNSPYEPGILMGVLIGLLASFIQHRFQRLVLPEYLQFFGGPRSVPLVMSVITAMLALSFAQVLPYISFGLEQLGIWMISAGGFGAFVYGLSYRLLIPFGLHHILNHVFWFQLGHFESEEGIVYTGDLMRFFAGDPSAGIYMAGLYPVMMFALPAVAIAIIQESRIEVRPKIKSVFLTAALTSFLTGVTEPIEFAFLFVAPVLFVIHAILSGLSMWIAYALDIHHGFSFSAGAIDFVLNQYLARNEMLLIPMGIAYAILYYILFRWAIRRFKIPTPGREEGSDSVDWAGDVPHRAPLILQALGGKDNILTMEACITRLRLTVKNDKLIDNAALKHLGASGIIRLGGGNVQVVFGTFSEMIRNEIHQLGNNTVNQVILDAPIQGRMIPLSEVPDQVFAEKIVGDGVAFIPERGDLVSPVKGKVQHLFPTLHAIGIRSDEGLDILLHIGIDTSELNGQHFKSFVKEGDLVEPGQLLIRFDLAKIKSHSKSTVTPMVITNVEQIKTWHISPYKSVKEGQKAVMSVTLKEISEESGGTDNV